MQSEPKSGKLNYRRKVTTSDLVHFLQVKTDYDDNVINSAIDTALGNRSAQPSNLPAAQDQDQTQDSPPNPSAKSQKQYNTDDATDVEPRYGSRTALPSPRAALPAPGTSQGAAQQEPQEPPAPGPQGRTQGGGKVKGQVSQTPGAVRKRAARSRRGVNEDFKDDPGEELSEQDVETVFKILSSPRPKAAQSSPQPKAAQSRQQTAALPQPTQITEVTAMAKTLEYMRLGRNRK